MRCRHVLRRGLRANVTRRYLDPHESCPACGRRREIDADNTYLKHARSHSIDEVSGSSGTARRAVNVSNQPCFHAPRAIDGRSGKIEQFVRAQLWFRRSGGPLRFCKMTPPAYDAFGLMSAGSSTRSIVSGTSTNPWHGCRREWFRDRRIKALL